MKHDNRKGWRCRLLNIVGLAAIVPGLAIHPAIIAIFMYYEVSPLILDYGSKYTLNEHWYGIVLVGIILYLPFSHFAIYGLPINKWIIQCRHANTLGIGRCKSWVTFLVVPFILDSFPIFLSLGILSQAMVFVPALNKKYPQNTFGKAIYDSITTDNLSNSTAFLITSVFLLLAFITFAIILLIVKFKPQLNSYLSNIISLRFCNNVDIMINDITIKLGKNGTNAFKYVIRFILVLPYSIIIFINILIVILLLYTATTGIINYGLSNIVDNAQISASNVALSQSIWETAKASFISAFIATLLVYWIAMLAGKKDGWSIGNKIQKVKNRVNLLILVPTPIYAFLVWQLWGHISFIAIVFLLSYIGLLYGLFGLQESFFNHIIGHERLRIGLSLNKYNFWLKTYTMVIGMLFLFFGCVVFLGWNDIVIQLFGQYGLPHVFLPIGRDGLSSYDKASLSLLQILVLLCSTPIAIKCYKHIKYMT
jgi:hypothetical protein